MKATISGIVTVTIDAIIGPNSSLSIPPLNSLIPSGGVESYIGEVGGKEGIKLEDQFVVTKDGLEQLSSFPYEIDI